MPGQIPQTKNPDPLGLQVAREVQKAVAPATVILFGSRAAGDHRPDSDVDLMIIAPDHKGAGSVTADANRWLRTAGPDLDVNIKALTQEEFDRRRRLGQSLAGQASRHGVSPMGERLEYNPQYDPHEAEIWEETRGWLERGQEHLQDYNEREDADHWNMRSAGHEAQQATENAMKGLLAAHDDHSRFRHDLSTMWDYTLTTLWRTGEAGQTGKQAVRDFLEHVTFPNSDKPGETLNWLTAYAEGYRYEIIPKERNREERKDLQYFVNRAVAALREEALYRRGTTQEDLFPQGKPWDK